ncbi:unnamed protein product [Soboliphyme baturini]|uniref:Secreted protein n=1 Tax=Soboliphyme baturini TaxID=241478 RepID=A0A183IFU9_9BILA|nr:unnamed protein product [Soboliphyme baturini]
MVIHAMVKWNVTVLSTAAGPALFSRIRGSLRPDAIAARLRARCFSRNLFFGQLYVLSHRRHRLAERLPHSRTRPSTHGLRSSCPGKRSVEQRQAELLLANLWLTTQTLLPDAPFKSAFSCLSQVCLLDAVFDVGLDF